jgi:hypothetical protein
MELTAFALSIIKGTVGSLSAQRVTLAGAQVVMARMVRSKAC